MRRYYDIPAELDKADSLKQSIFRAVHPLLILRYIMKKSKTKKLPTIQKVLGDIGESFVQKHLSINSDSSVRADAFEYLGLHLLRERIDEDFDYSSEAIRALTERCRNSSKCVRFDPRKRPCLKDDFYKKNYNAILSLDWHNTGDDKFRFYCANKLSKLEVRSYLEDVSPRNQFILDHLLCSSFIGNHYQLEAKAGKDYLSMSEVEKKEWNKYWNGHPGRLDFFAKKDGDYYCIDAKVNSSRLSLWQHVRMNWMMKCGYISQIYNVKVKYPDKEKLITTYSEEGVESAIDLVEAELNIINYNYSMSEHAEKIVSDRKNFLSIAQIILPSEEAAEKAADSIYIFESD